MSVDPRSPCIIGVGSRTWHPAETGDAGAPEPLLMWEEVARAAADDAGLGAKGLEALDGIEIVYCQTWQYDDPVARLAERAGRRARAPALLRDRRDHAPGAGAGRRDPDPRR